MENGLDSTVSGHFGHCKAFIISTVENGEIVKVEVMPNQGHTSCAEPVIQLVSQGVDVLITMGMGMRPFMAAQQQGLTVVRSSDATVGEAVRTYMKGVAELMDRDGLCGGGGGGCH